MEFDLRWMQNYAHAKPRCVYQTSLLLSLDFLVDSNSCVSPLFNRSGILKYMSEFPSRGASLSWQGLTTRIVLIWKRHQTVSNTDSYDNYDNYDDDLSSFDEIIRHRSRHKFHFNNCSKLFDLPYKPCCNDDEPERLQRRRLPKRHH